MRAAAEKRGYRLDSTARRLAAARELVGFIWDIVCHEMPKIQTTKP